MQTNHLTQKEQVVLDVLKRHPSRIGGICREAGLDKGTVKEILEKNLPKKHIHLRLNLSSGLYSYYEPPRLSFEPIPKSDLYTDKILVEVAFSDTHIGGLYAQPHLFHLINEIAKEEKADILTISGDIHNGLKHMDYNRGQNILNTSDLQIKAAVKAFIIFEPPLQVFIRPGDHDMWQMALAGINMVQNLVSQLNDLRKIEGKDPNFHYIDSDNDNRFAFKGFIFELHHIESAQSRGLTTKEQYFHEDRLGRFIKDLRSDHKYGEPQPHAVRAGNWHREMNFFHAGTDFELVPGLQRSTGWELGKGIVHNVGAIVKKLALDKYGNVFRVDRRYLDFSSEIKATKQKDFNQALMEFALKEFNV